MFWGKMKLSMLSLLVLVILAASCGPAQTPTPEVIKEVIKETVVVEQPVKETVVAEKEVTKVVERVVTPTPAMGEKPRGVPGVLRGYRPELLLDLLECPAQSGPS